MVDIGNGLIFHLRMDDIENNSLADEAGGRRLTTRTSISTTIGPFGPGGPRAMEFTSAPHQGVSIHRTSIGDPLTTNLVSATFAVWLQTDSSAGTEPGGVAIFSQPTLLGWDQSGDHPDTTFAYVGSSGGGIFSWQGYGDAGTTPDPGVLYGNNLGTESPNGVRGQGWIHLAAVHKDSQFKRIYKDGEVIASLVGGGAVSINVDPCFGARSESGGGGLNFPGALYDGRVYNRALSQDEVKALAGKVRTQVIT